MDLQWWITAIELPALAGLFWLLVNGRAASERAAETLRGDLAAFKLHVATTYASLTHLRETEDRLIGHLLRIDEKLDHVIEGRMGPRDDG